jgi:hypothetical protein
LRPAPRNSRCSATDRTAFPDSQFGPKASGLLISRFGRIVNTPDQAESWDVELRGKEKLAHMLRERRREALLYL